MIIPIARVKASIVSIFKLSPIACINANVPRIDTGRLTAATRVIVKFLKNKNTIRVASTAPRAKSNFTSAIDCFI